MGCNNRDVIRDSSEWVLYKLVSASGLYIFPLKKKKEKKKGRKTYKKEKKVFLVMDRSGLD